MRHRAGPEPKSPANKAVRRSSTPSLAVPDSTCHAGGRWFESRRSRLLSACKRHLLLSQQTELSVLGIEVCCPTPFNSPANISPVGPPPAITTACSVIATLRPAPCRSRPAHHIPPRRVPATALRVPRSVRRPRATPTSTTTHAFRSSHFRRFWPAAGDYAASTRGLPQAPLRRVNWRWRGVGNRVSLFVRCGRTTLPAKPRRAAYGDSVGPGGSPMSPRMQPRNDQVPHPLCRNSAWRY
jgi:hypothetical protein